MQSTRSCHGIGGALSSPWTARAQERDSRELRMTVRVMKPKDTAMGRGRQQKGLKVRTLEI